MTRPLRFLLVLTFFIAPAASAAQQFGGTAVVADDQIIVGETRNQTLSGIVYVYEKDGTEWSNVAELRVTDELRSPDGFGAALAYEDGKLAVGAPLMNDGAGAVYVFERDGSGAWAQIAELIPSGSNAEGRFGTALGWWVGNLVVGAPEASNGRGAVVNYEEAGENTWQAGPATVAPDPDVRGFGARLSVYGLQMLAAAPGSRGAASTVYVMGLSPEGWQSMGILNVDGLPERSGFGDALLMTEGVALVGAPGVDQRSGRVYLFDLINGTAEDPPGATLGPALAEANSRFGASIGSFERQVWVGAPGTQGLGGVYAFGTRGADLNGIDLLSMPTIEQGASLGASVAPSDNVAVVGATGVDEGSGLAVVFERDGDTWTQTATLANEPRGFPAIAGDEIHCTEGQASLFDCKDVNITAFLPIGDLGGSRGTRVNDVWGWTDPESEIEYVIVGRTNGTSFVDISDPYNPVYVGDLPKTEGTRTTIWRDMKVYANHVYIVADAAGEHGVQVFDLTQLREFDGEPITFDETFRYDGIHSAHNIVINEETGFAYAVGNSGGGETCGGGLHMINLENPAQPTFAGCFSEMGTGRRGTGYSHDAQCVVYRGPDEDHQGKEICLGSNETALNIADVTDKSAPVSIATASYPIVVYAHQGWLTEDHTFFYMNDEGDEPQGLVDGTRTLVWDVTDLDDPILVKEHIAETTATDHNLYVKGDRMYQSNYSAGFRVLDVSNPADPVEIGFFDTSPYEGGASWSNYPFFESGIIAVTGTGDGLFLVRDMARRNLVP